MRQEKQLSLMKSRSCGRSPVPPQRTAANAGTDAANMNSSETILASPILQAQISLRVAAEATAICLTAAAHRPAPDSVGVVNLSVAAPRLPEYPLYHPTNISFPMVFCKYSRV